MRIDEENMRNSLENRIEIIIHRVSWTELFLLLSEAQQQK